jgi:hypothetical protein
MLTVVEPTRWKLAEDPSAETEEAPEPEPEWPLDPQLEKLESYDLREVEGRERLGALAFGSAPDQLEEIIEILHELRIEPWDRLDPTFAGEVTGQLNGLIELVDTMLALTAAEPNAQEVHADYQQRLNDFHQYFRRSVRPRCIKAQVREEIALQSPAGAEAEARERIKNAQRRVDELEKREADLARKLEALESPVEAQREAATASATEDLSADYTRQADDHAKAWKRWLACLLVAVGLALTVGVPFVLATHPDTDATNAEIASAILIDLLVVGLLLYLVRMASLQFRVHRNLEAVARSKAAALSTFNRIVVGPAEADVRTAVAQILAQAVFATDSTGFIDAPSDHITLLERVVGPVVQRASQQ